jgi:hypothetical protein
VTVRGVTAFAGPDCDRRSAAEVNLLDEAANPILDRRVKTSGQETFQTKRLSDQERLLKPRPGRKIMWVLLLVPFVGLLWVPFYNFQEPALFGFPFFYWYQLVWVPICSLLIWLVYRSRTPDETP